MNALKTRKTVLGALCAGAAALALAAAPMGAGRVGPDEVKAKIGEKAPDFTLTDTDGKSHTLSSLTAEGKIVVLEWFNPECPFVVKHYKDNTTMADTYKKYKDQKVAWLAINSGAPGKQGAGKDKNAQYRKDWNIQYPVLLDENGVVGRAYGSKNTPTMYIVGKDGVLAYWGAIDNNPGKELGSVNYVSQALDQILAGSTVTEPKTKPYGCSVKYGEAPKSEGGKSENKGG